MNTRRPVFIIEAPGKRKKLEDLLRQLGYDNPHVEATRGVLYNLPEKELGLDPKTHEFTDRVLSHPDKIHYLKDGLADCSTAWVLTDSDDQGEWIAEDVFNMAQEAGCKDIRRGILLSLTTSDLKRALDNPVPFNSRRSSIAQSKRIIDREIGYILSRGSSTETGEIPAALGRVLTPFLSSLSQEHDKDHSERTIPAGYLVRDIPCTDREGNWSIVASYYPGQDAKEIAWILDSLPLPEVVLSSESRIDEGVPDGCGLLCTLAETLEAPVVKVSQSLQSLYVKGRISYPRSDSSSVDGEHARQLQLMAAKAGIKLDPKRLQGDLTGSENAPAHSAPVTLDPSVDPYAPLRALALEDQIMTTMAKIAVNAGAAGGYILQQNGKISKDSHYNYDGWQKLLTLCDISIYRHIRKTQHTARPIPVVRTSSDQPRGDSITPNVRHAPISPDTQVVMRLLSLGLGRPSTLGYHADKITTKYMDESGGLRPGALMALKRARTIAPALLDPETVKEMEEVLESSGEMTNAERVRGSLDVLSLREAIEGIDDPRDRTPTPEPDITDNLFP